MTEITKGDLDFFLHALVSQHTTAGLADGFAIAKAAYEMALRLSQSSAIDASEVERATIEKVVGWLMNIDWCSESHNYATAFADAIERGEWK